jgi:hypothetical protein
MNPWKDPHNPHLHDGGSFTFDNSVVGDNPRPMRGRLYTLHWDDPFKESSIPSVVKGYTPPEEGKTCLVLGMDGYIVEVLIDGETKGVPLWGWRWEPLE